MSEAAKPKMFQNKIGENVLLDTISNQQARELNELYVKYTTNKTNTEIRMKAILDLQTFFARVNFKFKDDIILLLQQELDLLTKGLTKLTGLRNRIERFIFYFVKWIFCNNERNNKFDVIVINDMTHYRNILKRLQEEEMKTFKCFTSVCFKMEVSEIWYLIHEIWEDKSAINECRDLEKLRMIRWQKTFEWNPWNCILLSKYEIRNHLKKTDVEAEYEKYFVSKIRNKHLRGKIHFTENDDDNKSGIK